MALPSNITTYRELSAALHAFYHEAFYSDDYLHPSRATNYLQTTGLMEYWLARHFRTMYADFGSRLPRPTFPLIRNVVSTKAVALKEQFRVYLTDGRTGNRLDADAVPVAGRINDLVEESGLTAALREHEETSVCQFTAGLRLSVQDGEIGYTSLAPFAMDIVASKASPADPARARQILVPLTGMDYVPGFRSDELRWAYERVPGRGVYCQVVDPDGRPVLVGDRPIVPIEALTPDGLMPTGMAHPVVVWKERESPGPFAPPPLSLYYAQVDLLLELAAATLAVRIGAHGTLTAGKRSPSAPDWMRTSGGNPIADEESADGSETGAQAGQPVTPVRIPGSVHSVLVRPDDWDVSILQPRVDPLAYAQWIQAKIRLSYMAEDMVPSTANITDPQPSNVSGKARMQEQAPRLLAKSRREARLAEQVVAVLKVWRVYHNLTCRPEDRIPDGVGFQVRFSEIWSPDVLADQSVVQAYQGAADMGLLDLIELRQQIDGTTYADAKSSFWRSSGTRKRALEPLPEMAPAAA